MHCNHKHLQIHQEESLTHIPFSQFLFPSQQDLQKWDNKRQSLATACDGLRGHVLVCHEEWNACCLHRQTDGCLNGGCPVFFIVKPMLRGVCTFM